MAADYNFPEIVKGDTFTERKILIDEDGTPIDLTGATVCFQLKTKYSNDLVKEMPTTISDATGGEITLNEFDVYLNPDIYIYDFKITRSDGTTLTYFKGNFKVLKTISECTT